MPQITIDINGDTSDLNKEISNAERQLQTLERRREARVRIGADTSAIDARINSTTQNLTRLRTSLNQTSAASNNLSRSTANGSNTLTQFSRIAQDAPFGIIGIGNNLTATAEAFSNLSRSSGGAGNALRAVGASLLGSGGILLAVSLVTTGLTYMAQKGITVSDVFDKLNGTFDETAKALNDIAMESAKSAGTEIAGLKGLVSVAQDETLSREKRLIAVKKLQDEFPAYFGNLRQEQILNGDVKGAVNDVSKALIARATATALAGKLGELAAKRLVLEEQRESNILDIQKQQLYIDKQLAKGTNSTKGISAEEYRRINLKALSEQYRDTVRQIKELDAESKRYSDRENKATADSILLLKTKDKIVKPKKVFDTPQVSAIKTTIQATDLVDVQGIEVLNGQIDQFGNKIKELPGVMHTGFAQARNVVSQETIAMYELMYNFSNDVNSLISGSITDTFNQLGTSIGEALANGQTVFSAIGNSLLQSLGKFLSDMGGLLIQYGTLAVVKGKLDIAIATGGPVAIAAGVAAIAVGVALKAVGGAIGSKAKNGGSSVSSNSGASQQYSGSSFASSGGSTSGGTVVFEIAGQKLIGVLNNTLDSNSRIGGSISI